jgi:hypothetical protein
VSEDKKDHKGDHHKAGHKKAVLEDEKLVAAEPGTEAYTKTGGAPAVDNSDVVRGPEDFYGAGQEPPAGETADEPEGAGPEKTSGE